MQARSRALSSVLDTRPDRQERSQLLVGHAVSLELAIPLSRVSVGPHAAGLYAAAGRMHAACHPSRLEARGGTVRYADVEAACLRTMQVASALSRDPPVKLLRLCTQPWRGGERLCSCGMQGRGGMHAAGWGWF